jgi:N-acetylglucosaminyl-diphospho-decaprenol L-rhamnosyltransferase
MDNNNYKDLTIVVVSYAASNNVLRLLKKIPKEIKVIVVEASKDYILKKKVSQKFLNATVIIPPKNNGNGAGINFGYKYVKTKFFIYIDCDVYFKKDLFKILLASAKKINTFGILSPKQLNENQEDYVIGFDKKYNLKKLSYANGAVMLFNKKDFKKVGFFDEKIFLYFEESDYFIRCHKKKKNIYYIEKAICNHIGSQSMNKKYLKKYRVLRSWHYCWAKFYFFRKHNGYFFAFRKTAPNLIRAIKNIFKYAITLNHFDLILSIAELRGLIASYLLRRSSLRMTI